MTILVALFCHTRPYNSGSAHSIGTADLAHANGHESALQQHIDAAISPPIVSAYKLQAIAAPSRSCGVSYHFWCMAIDSPQEGSNVLTAVYSDCFGHCWLSSFASLPQTLPS